MPKSSFIALCGLVLWIFSAGAALSIEREPIEQNPAEQESQQPFDLVLAGGKVLDGTGNPWRYADVAIADGLIVAVGDLDNTVAARTIDVTGKTVTPGFIDVHSHADGPTGHRDGLRAKTAERRSAPNLVSQGITTVVVNQDGQSPHSIADQRSSLQKLGFGPNVVLMVGHNSIRRQALGPDFKHVAKPAELKTMISLLRQGIEEGAYGMTAGLEYIPGRWSDTNELIELVSVLKQTGGVYIVHERASGADPMWFLPSQDEPGPPTMLDNIKETIEIADRTGTPTIATHIKVRGADYWGTSGAIINLVRSARNRGVELWLDQYPYSTTGSDGNTLLIPPWALEYDRWGEVGSTNGGGRNFSALLQSALEDEEFRGSLEQDIKREITRRGGADQIFIFDYPNPSKIGLTLDRFARGLGLDPVQAAIRLQLEGFQSRPGGARLRGFSLSEVDVEPLAAEPYTLTASDAGIALASEDLPVHARFYGTFPRKIRHYAMERGVLSVESVIRSSTSLPAQVLRLKDRGLIQVGLAADIVVLDLGRIRDLATFTEPHQFSEGVDWVFVGGEAVIERGKRTGALPGKVLSLANSSFAEPSK